MRSEAFGGSVAQLTRTLQTGLQDGDKIRAIAFSHQAGDTLLQKPQEANARPHEEQPPHMSLAWHPPSAHPTARSPAVAVTRPGSAQVRQEARPDPEL